MCRLEGRSQQVSHDDSKSTALLTGSNTHTYLFCTSQKGVQGALHLSVVAWIRGHVSQLLWTRTGRASPPNARLAADPPKAIFDTVYTLSYSQ